MKNGRCVIRRPKVFQIGATEQNLLKLFGRIVDDPTFSIPILPEPRASGERIIY